MVGDIKLSIAIPGMPQLTLFALLTVSTPPLLLLDYVLE